LCLAHDPVFFEKSGRPFAKLSLLLFLLGQFATAQPQPLRAVADHHQL
jgi:hypothetical protein